MNGWKWIELPTNFIESNTFSVMKIQTSNRKPINSKCLIRKVKRIPLIISQQEKNFK